MQQTTGHCVRQMCSHLGKLGPFGLGEGWSPGRVCRRPNMTEKVSCFVVFCLQHTEAEPVAQLKSMRYVYNPGFDKILLY